MSSIDLGNEPVGTPPTPEQQTQIRSALGALGDAPADTKPYARKDGDWVEVADGLGTSATILATPDDDLAAKYAEAKALTPNGSALSATNRAALVLMPGVYTLAAELAVDTNYVDVIGLGAGEFTPAVEFAQNTINVTAWDVRVVGISAGTQEFKVSPRPNITGVTGAASNNSITIANHGLRIGDVVHFSALTGGDGLATNVRYVVDTSNFSSGEFHLRLESTGNLVTFSTDVTAGTLVIEANGSQRFDICTGGDASFGVGDVTASGTFTNCMGGWGSFGGIASGTFTNCTGGDRSFGSDGMAIASGTFTNCTGGYESFGVGTSSGTFTNCTGGDGSFGGGGGTLSGKLYYCRLTSGPFETVSGGGITRLCIDGNNNENNQG